MIGAPVAIVLQARLGSTRLSGKALAPIAGTPLVARCVARLKQAGAGFIVLATTARSEDDVLAEEGLRLGIQVHRGDSSDVLGRFAEVTRRWSPHYIVRATGDNPAVDPDSVGRLLAVAKDMGVDHAVEVDLPYGCTVEIVAARALLTAASVAVTAADREHVTPFIRRPESGYRCAAIAAPVHLRRPDLRFTVDTADDLAYMRRVIGAAGSAEAPLADLIATADRLGPRSEAA